MIRLHSSLSRSILCIAATLAPVVALSGCAIGAAFPDASANPSQEPLGTISGSNFGGHAPLVGAHVYVLQPSVTTPTGTSQATASYNAYAGQATSLLGATYQNNGQSGGYNATAQNSSGTDPGIPTTWYYQTTDLTGAFNISGDYTCTAGLPVYLYLVGGSPTYPSQNNQFSISTITWSGSAAPYTVTMTLNTSTSQPLENFYVGELFGVNNSYILPNGSALTSAGGSPLNGQIHTIIAGSGSTALSTTQFSFTYGDSSTALPSGVTLNQPYTETGTGQVTFEPTNNAGVVNLAVLGNCPSGGFTGSNKISYVYVNEVSTVAAAYAFRPFTFTPSTSNQINGATAQTSCASTYNGNTYYWNNATCIGTSSTNLAGLQNAANIAGQLYDITGSNLSTTYAGEGHIARANTTNGNGIVPQANIDTIANIIAACVDSANGSNVVGSTGNYSTNGTYSGISAQCNTLFNTATSSGVLSNASSGAGIQPFDTAMAAFNIARHPGGPPAGSSSSASTFMTNLYTLPQANPPFAPSLASTGAGQPNDFTIGILYPQSLNSPYTNTAESVAIDKIGNAWVTAQNGISPAYFYEMSPIGVRSNVQSQSNYIYGYVTVDSNQNAWAGAAIDTVSGSTTTPGAYGFSYVQKSGTTSSTSVYPNPYTYNAGGVNSNKLESYTYASAADSVGNVYFGNNGTYSANSTSTGRPTDFIETLSGAATTPTVTGTESAQIPTFTSSNGGVTHMAIQPTGTSAYIDYNASNGHGTPYLGSVVLSSGANNFTEITPSSSGCSGLTDPEAMAVDRNGDAIFPDYDNGGGTINTATSSLYFVPSTGGCTQYSGATLGGGLLSPFGITVDGNDYGYVTNRGSNNGNSISIFNLQNVSSSTLPTAISPATGLIPQYVSGGALTSELNGPLNIAAGPSGTLWITNPAGNSLVEIIGLANPTSTPLAYAAQTIANNFTVGTVGLRP